MNDLREPGGIAPARASVAEVVSATRTWLEKAVIGLGLCPFAAAVHKADRLRYVVSEQRSEEGLLVELGTELQALHTADPGRCETTLLIHPHVLSDFNDYNQFLAQADRAVASLGLDGELQIASFHPGYRFAGTAPQDIENYTNRSPYPMLHLLREASVAQAVANFPDIDAIGPNNIRTLHRLGPAGWNALLGNA